jgi:Predicted ATPases
MVSGVRPGVHQATGPALLGSAARVKTQHSLRGENGAIIGAIEFGLEEQESRGTNRLFALAGPDLAAHDSSAVLVIDEIEAQLHPDITREIYRMFSFGRPEGSRAQLVAATHDTNLLDPRLLRRDQIWFVQKDEREASELYSLAEIKVRAEASFERDYLLGRYGGAPQVTPAELLRAGGLW